MNTFQPSDEQEVVLTNLQKWYLANVLQLASAHHKSVEEIVGATLSHHTPYSTGDSSAAVNALREWTLRYVSQLTSMHGKSLEEIIKALLSAPDSGSQPKPTSAKDRKRAELGSLFRLRLGMSQSPS